MEKKNLDKKTNEMEKGKTSECEKERKTKGK